VPRPLACRRGLPWIAAQLVSIGGDVFVPGYLLHDPAVSASIDPQELVARIEAEASPRSRAFAMLLWKKIEREPHGSLRSVIVQPMVRTALLRTLFAADADSFAREMVKSLAASEATDAAAELDRAYAEYVATCLEPGRSPGPEAARSSAGRAAYLIALRDTVRRHINTATFGPGSKTPEPSFFATIATNVVGLIAVAVDADVPGNAKIARLLLWRLAASGLADSTATARAPIAEGVEPAPRSNHGFAGSGAIDPADRQSAIDLATRLRLSAFGSEDVELALRELAALRTAALGPLCDYLESPEAATMEPMKPLGPIELLAAIGEDGVPALLDPACYAPRGHREAALACLRERGDMGEWLAAIEIHRSRMRDIAQDPDGVAPTPLRMRTATPNDP
jgi:hypothetical protein